jgi:tRNA nucleotidyltransferase/poly(A) polymerase
MSDGGFRPDDEELASYAGRWVALIRGRVVGQGGTPHQALQAAKANRHKETPEIIYVEYQNLLTFPSLLYEVRAFLPENISIYLVGGAVRDALLGRASQDLDFVVQGDAIRAARYTADALKMPFFILDEARGTARVIVTMEERNRYLLDFATMQGSSIEYDLNNRDFTINAIAVDVKSPNVLFDPLGGASDLLSKRLRACSPTAIQADPIRILRAIRLAANLGLKIVPETRKLMHQTVDLIPNTSPERQRDELAKILGGPQPATSLRALDILGALTHLFPELSKQKNLSQPPPHIHDVWNHSLKTVQYLETLLNVLGTTEHDPESSANFIFGLSVLQLGRYRKNISHHVNSPVTPDRHWRQLLFLAALYHDIGKPSTHHICEDGRIKFIGHEKIGSDIIASRARKMRLSNHEIFRLKTIVRHHMRPHFLAQTDKLPTRRAIYRFFRDTKDSGVDICLINLADVLATYNNTLPQKTWERYLDVHRELLKAWFENFESQVDTPNLLTGNKIIQFFGLKPGPQIGKLLEEVREAQACGEIKSQEDAIEFVEKKLSH